MAKTLDLNIGKNALNHLTISDAIKELIANALDEHELINCDKDIIVSYIDDNLYIKDFGRGITPNNFILESNVEKRNNNNIIGMFGYGLKDALGIFASNSINVQIATKTKIFIPTYLQKDNTNVLSLHVTINDNKLYNISDEAGTIIKIDKIKESDIEKAKNKFLYFTKPKILYNDINCKIFKNSEQQFIYINGLEVIPTSNHFSYNFTINNYLRKYFNRDRKDFDKEVLDKYCVKILQYIKLYNNGDNNSDFIQYIKEILTKEPQKKKSNVKDELQEFTYVKVLCNIIISMNSSNKYIFIDSEDNNDERLLLSKREVIVLNNMVKKRLSINQIYGCEYLYTIANLPPIPPVPQEPNPIIKQIQLEINKLREEFNENFDENMENQIDNITVVDDDDEKYMISKENIKVSIKHIKSKKFKKDFTKFLLS